MSSELDREKGIEAIIALQAFAGITETKEEARRGWDSMSASEQRQTMAAYELVCGGDEEEADS